MTTIREYLGRRQAKRVRDAVKKGTTMSELVRKRVGFKLDDVVEDSSGLIKFAGYANVGTPDRTGDLIEPGVWKKAIKPYMDYGGTLYFMHDWGAPIGHIDVMRPDAKGLYVEGGIEKNESPDTGEPVDHPLARTLDYARMALKKKLMKSLSVGIRVYGTAKAKVRDDVRDKEVDVRKLTDIELLEISLVTIPASRESVVNVKDLFAHMGAEWADIEPEEKPDDTPKPEPEPDSRVKLVSLRDEIRPPMKLVSIKESRH